MIRRPPRSTQSRSSAASDVYKRQRLGGTDEVAAQLGSGRLRGLVLGLEDLDVRTDPSSVAATLQEIEEATFTVDVVVGKIELGDPGTGQRQVVLGRVPRDQLVLDDPVDL